MDAKEFLENVQAFKMILWLEECIEKDEVYESDEYIFMQLRNRLLKLYPEVSKWLDEV